MANKRFTVSMQEFRTRFYKKAGYDGWACDVIVDTGRKPMTYKNFNAPVNDYAFDAYFKVNQADTLKICNTTVTVYKD